MVGRCAVGRSWLRDDQAAPILKSALSATPLVIGHWSLVISHVLILASASPRRSALLSQAGYDFVVLPADVEEVAHAHLTPAEITLFNARAKALAIARQRRDAIVLGADTIVAFEGEIFGKPRDLDHALAMLRRLNGRIHEVWSGVWLVRGAPAYEVGFNEVTRVRFRRLDDAQIRAYLARIGPLDKAGAYAAQDDRGELIECVEGCFDNVVGLPMKALARALERFA
jgi:septum formation protein